MFARIENETVVELIDVADITGMFHASLRWLPCGSTTRLGDVVRGGIVMPQDNYAVLREAAYPPITDFIDGMVKVHSADPAISAAGGAQVAAYCDACLAVKARYPIV